MQVYCMTPIPPASATPPSDQDTEARQRAWAEENSDGFEAYDRFVERHGVFGDGRRLFRPPL